MRLCSQYTYRTDTKPEGSEISKPCVKTKPECLEISKPCVKTELKAKFIARGVRVSLRQRGFCRAFTIYGEREREREREREIEREIERERERERDHSG